MANEKTEMEKRNALRLSNEESNKLTRECLQTALILLMAEKDIDKISVTELVAKAGVSRTAFYSNYTSKEEILTSWLADFVERISGLAWETISRGNLTALYIQLFDHLREHADCLQVLIRANMEDMLFSRMEENVLQRFKARDRLSGYLVSAWCGAFNSLLLRWVKDGMQESSEELAGMCRELSEYFISRLDTEFSVFTNGHWENHRSLQEESV